MKYLPLFVIFLVGLILRFAFLGDVPISIHRDEAFLGYNGYSILKTGNDISGKFLPFHLESFFMSPAGYSYFSIPFLAIFGLSDIGVRFASAFFGVLTIPFVYLLSKRLFINSKNNNSISLLASFLFAISPWHINLSRVATENVIVTFFIVLGVYLYLVFKKNPKTVLLIASFISFGLTLLLYQAPRAFLPLFIPTLLIYTNEKVKDLVRIKMEYFLYILLILIPIILIVFSPELSWRIKSLSIFNHAETSLVLNEQLTTDSVQGLPYVVSRMFHNKVLAFGLLISENFFKHLSFDFLFYDGGFPDRYRIPRIGLLYMFELPILLFGLYFLIRNNLKTAVFLSTWIIFGIFGSALTSDDVPNLQRILLILPALSIIASFGGVSLYHLISKKSKLVGKAFLFIAGLVILFSVGYYLVQYYFQGKVYRTWYRQDGYKEMVIKVNELVKNYKYAVITDRESTPAVFFMYYGSYDPEKLQNETEELDMRGAGDIPFGKYRFTNEECPVRFEINTENEKRVIGEKGVLYVNSGLCKEIPEEAEVINTIKRADNSTAFIILHL